MNEAAKAMFISQPSLSASVKDLEDEIGIEIFIRSNRGISLTPEGKEFLGYARQVVQQYELIEKRYIDKGEYKKRFSVSMQHYTFAVNAFIEVINRYGIDEYDFSVYETRTNDVILNVRNFKSEVGILYLNDFNRKVLEKIFAENDIDRVVHFAAESHVDRSIKNPEVFVRTNVLGTAVMLNCAKAAWELPDGTFKEGKKFLHVSTDEVYGSLPDDENAFFYETSPYEPHSPYSASKASSDMLVKAYMDTYKFPANITNCSNNYGPYQFPEKLIPLIINNALQGKKLPVYGDGKNVRDWLFVEDHAKAIDMVQEKGRLFETYNVGGHNEKQNIEIINIIIETLQEMLPEGDPRKALVSKDLITYVEDRKGHDRRYAIAPDKIKAEIGWYPETMFKEGIKKTIAWFFEHEDWMKNVTSGDYQKYYEDMYKNK